MVNIGFTKSSFVCAERCNRWAWLNRHAPIRGYSPNPIGSAADIGQRIGVLARGCFPGGLLVDEGAVDHNAAVERTLNLLADSAVAAIFEAAFIYRGHRVRVDILVRVEPDRFAIIEVKSVGSPYENNGALKKKYLDDVAFQYWVVTSHLIESAPNVSIDRVSIMHPDKAYVRAPGGIDPMGFMTCVDVTAEAVATAAGVERRVASHTASVDQQAAPKVLCTKTLCRKADWGPSGCDYWERCSSDAPEDWIELLPRVRTTERADWLGRGITRISDLPKGEVKGAQRENIWHAVNKGELFIGENLQDHLADFGPPAIHLDFEYLPTCALPLHTGTSAFQLIPFQYSAHLLGERGEISHIGEYLAPGSEEDPSREFAEHLLALMDQHPSVPIVAYNAPSAEIRVLKELARRFPDLEAPLTELINRIVDLLPLVREGVMAPSMIKKDALNSSIFSLKNVTPAFVEGFSYADLPGVKNGGQAVEAYIQLTLDEMESGVTREDLRRSMLAYCEKDTEATALLHRALLSFC